MTEHREILKSQRAKYEGLVRSLKSYVNALTETTAKHGTDEELYWEDMMKAQRDIEYYEGEATRHAEALGDAAGRRIFQVYEDAGGEWRWRLVAGNERIIAVSGEGYRDRRDCLHAIELVKDSKEAGVEGGD